MEGFENVDAPACDDKPASIPTPEVKKEDVDEKVFLHLMREREELKRFNKKLIAENRELRDNSIALREQLIKLKEASLDFLRLI